MDKVDKQCIFDFILNDIVDEAIEKALGNDNVEKKLDIASLFGVDTIPKDELEKQYIDLSFIVSSSGYGGRFCGYKGRIIKEEATTTLSPEDTKEEMQEKFKLKDWQFSIQNGANGIEIIVLYPSIFKNTRLIKDAMLACGWSVSTKSRIVKDGMVWNAMSFDPLYQRNVSEEARQHEYLYHWTPLYNFASIKKEGLKPKSENRAYGYPDTVYFMIDTARKPTTLVVGGIAVNSFFIILCIKKKTLFYLGTIYIIHK